MDKSGITDAAIVNRRTLEELTEELSYLVREAEDKTERLCKVLGSIDQINAIDLVHKAEKAAEKMNRVIDQMDKLASNENTIFEHLAQRGYDGALHVLNSKLKKIQVNENMLKKRMDDAMERHIQNFDARLGRMETRLQEELDALPIKAAASINTAASTIRDMAHGAIEKMEFRAREIIKAVRSVDEEDYEVAATKINIIGDAAAKINNTIMTIEVLDEKIMKWNNRIDTLRNETVEALRAHKEILREMEKTNEKIREKGEEILSVPKSSGSGYLVIGIVIGVVVMIALNILIRNGA